MIDTVEPLSSSMLSLQPYAVTVTLSGATLVGIELTQKTWCRSSKEEGVFSSTTFTALGGLPFE